MPYRMTLSVRHRAIEVHYYYYLLSPIPLKAVGSLGAFSLFRDLGRYFKSKAQCLGTHNDA